MVVQNSNNEERQTVPLMVAAAALLKEGAQFYPSITLQVSVPKKVDSLHKDYILHN